MAEVKAKDGQNPKWVRCDLGDIFKNDSLQKLIDDIVAHHEVTFTEDTSVPPPYDFPDFGASRLQAAALKHVCSELGRYLDRAVAPVTDIPSVMILQRRAIVWERVIQACQQQIYSDANLRRVFAALKKGEEGSVEEKGKRGREEGKKDDASKVEQSSEKLSGNQILVEVGVKAGLSVVFSLLRQAWAQLAWQKQFEEQMKASGVVVPFARVNLPNEVLKSVLEVMKGVPPLSLSNMKSLSHLGTSCLQQASEFLSWVIQPESYVDAEGKRLATEILFSLALQHGSLNYLIEWVDEALSCLVSYAGREDAVRPSLSLEFCHAILEEIRKRSQIGSLAESVAHKPFEPQELTADGSVSLLEFALFLCQQLAIVSQNCTQYFSQGSETEGEEERFLSETCEVLAFGSNSSSQLAMGSTEKLMTATSLAHMANCQVIEAGQYCSFVIYSDGTMKACGKGSYGRLGLGTSDTQTTMKEVNTFPPGTLLRRMASSRGSDGHSLAITAEGQIYSWGDGNYGKLGHGDNATQKSPKLIAAFAGKVVRSVACGNRHTAAVTMDGELYTWGEGDYGRLGHGNTSTQKTPTKVQNIGAVRQVACGAAHTLVLAMDGVTVWSFGSGDSGKLGHGDTNRQTVPKVIEGLHGMVCQKVCAASQFSLVLTAPGKVYSFGNGSGVGKGTTEPRQYTPWMVEALEGEMIIDISTGDGHCLALTQRGEVYAWGTNSMGQCGQGHSNGSITTPSKVKGLDGVQVQQISAGTSHSIVWTAVPVDRRASAMWHWPYCVSVSEKTFEHLLSLLTQYGSISGEHPLPPFTSRESHESFLLSVLSLTRTHLSLVAPLGPSCVHMACGSQVKPLRTLLFKLIDSQVPPALDQVTSEALEVGSSVLLPPILDRLDILLSILPEDPSLLTSLTTGQRRQLDILLSGFQERGELAGLLVDEEWMGGAAEGWVSAPHVKKLFTLCDRMVEYLHEATLAFLESPSPPSSPPDDLQLGSPLLLTFQQFLLSTYLNVTTMMESNLDWAELSDHLSLPLSDQLSMLEHFELFYNMLKEHSLPVLRAVASQAREKEDPMAFLSSVQNVVFGFLAHSFPSHIALTIHQVPAFDIAFSVDDLFMELAKAVHALVVMLPPSLVEEMEREELQCEPNDEMLDKVDVEKLRGVVTHPWRELADFQRLLCLAAAKSTEFFYTSTTIASEHHKQGQNQVLDYTPKKGRSSLLSSHLLSNGVVGDSSETAEAIYTWVSLCKTLPNTPKRDSEKEEEGGRKEAEVWSNYLIDYNELRKQNSQFQDARNHLDLLHVPVDIEPCDPAVSSTLLALAVGGMGNKQAEMIYNNMMEFARCRDWNTCSDEDALPQLRRVSCAALACLLKHTGLSLYATNCGTKPKKNLVDVYRAVFTLRREVFTNRPLPDFEGIMEEEARRRFEEKCNGICATLFFLTCVLNPAMPEESEPIVPQISTSTPTGSSTSDDVAIRSPGSSAHHKSGSKSPQRLFSHPEVKDDSSSVSPKPEPSVLHSASHVVASTSTHGWSLAAVKQALSHHRWQKDRMDMHASRNPGSESSLHQKITGIVVDIVSVVFQEEEEVLDRKELLYVLMNQQQRAVHRLRALQKVTQFVTEMQERGDDFLLPSSRLVFLSCCIAHDVHYSDNITAAPSILQHEIKNLSHTLLQQIVARLHSVEPKLLPESTILGLQRELLLALQWTNFQHDPSDLQLLFTGYLYPKIVALAGVVSTKVLPEVVHVTHSHLEDRVRTACTLVMQLLGLRVGMNAEVLQTRPDILSTMSEHLFGQLEGYLCITNMANTLVTKWEVMGRDIVEVRESRMGDFLCFVNTLSATHKAIRAVLASDMWFGTLLKIVDINPDTGVPVVVSLKTRLLALQVLGAIMAELSENSPLDHTTCTKIIEDLLELMYRCMFLAPVSHFQENLKLSPSDKNLGQMVVLPFSLDSAHQHGCTVTVEGECVVVEGSGVDGYSLGQLSLSSGKYSWKVSVECPNAAFCVGVGQKPLTNRQVGSSGQFWTWEGHTGRLYHEGESNELLFIVKEGDSVTVEYDTVAKTLSFGKNDGGLSVAFHNVVKQGRDLYPVLLFTRRHNTTKVKLHPIRHISHSPLAHLHRQEQLTSGYPLLSPTGITLTQAVVSLIYQLQEKEPWKSAITQVVCSRLGEMDVLIHRLLDVQVELETPQDTVPQADSILPALSLLMKQFTQVVWPCLAVIGGLDSGFYLGRECRAESKGEVVTATVVTIPDSEQKVEIQDQVTPTTAEVKKRSVSLSALKLLTQKNFSLSLILDHLTPSILINLAHLAGYLDVKHSLLSILQQAHSSLKSFPQVINKSLPYHQLCESSIQMAATKSLHTILFNESVIRLLNYQPPSIDVVVAGGYMDKSELASTVCEVLKCLVARAIKPSPLKPSLKLLELERVHAVLTYECLASTAEYVYHHGQPLVETEPSTVSTVGNVSPASSSPPPTPTDNSPPVVPLDGRPPPPPIFPLPTGGGRRENGAQAPTPPMVHVLADMGFSRAQINVAIDKCEIPPNTGEESRMQLLVSWIIDHPDAVSEEEARLERLRVEQEEEEERRRREEQQQQQQEADQNAAASEFLSLFGEMFDPSHVPTSPIEEGDVGEGEEREKDTKHAPDLLEGPSINSEVPDVSLSGMDTSPQSLKTLLSALGLSQKRPTPRRFEFSNTDPLGEHLYKREHESGAEGEGQSGEGEGDGGGEEDIPEGVGVVKMGHTCGELVQQAQKLRSLGENFTAINRITAATQTLVARHVTMLVISTLSTQGKRDFISGLKALDLVDVKSLVRLLRLVHAGRIDGTPGKAFSVKTPSSLLPIKGLDCLGSAITAVVTESHSAGLQLMYACARDLLAAAVGGAELLQKGTRRRRRPHRRGHAERTPQFDWKEKSDLSTLSNPNFSVSQNLVQMMADMSGKMLLGNGSSVASSDGVLQITDALAACLFSSKLEPEHRFWGLEQLLKMFSSTSKEQLAKMNPQDLVAPSQLEHLTGHKGQIMACVENKREKKLVSIGEDNTLLLWDMQAAQPETVSLPFPTSSSSPSSPSSPGLLLPVLAQSSNHTCVAGALNDTLCIWRVKDGKTVSETLPELITALQWKISQKDGEVPLLVVGLLDGQLVLAEVLRASVNLSPELQLTRLEHFLKGAVCCISWSPNGSHFAVASTSHCVQVYRGSGREYVPATEIKELQVTSMCWSPEGSYLTTLEEDGIMKLWNVSSDTPTIFHSFGTHPTYCMTWHNVVDESGKMLLASGSQDGTVHLWTVQGKEPTDESYEDASPIDQSDSSIGVEHVTSFHGHAAPITMLVFCESAVLLASGCKAGAIRVWDLWSGSLLKFATRAVGEVVHLAWTSHGLTVCYKNTSTLCLLPPGPGDYLGERCIHSCLPTLHLHTITDPTKAPCLMALLKNLHHVLLDQYQYEEGELCSAHQLVHSQYLQLLTALAVGLGLNSVLISPPHPPHFDPPPPAKEWQWLSDFTRAVKMSEMLNKRLPLPKDCGFSLPKDVQPLDSSEKYQPTDNAVWTLPMDVQILEWVVQKPEDWWLSTRSTVYTWGKGSWHQLGHSTRERVLPTVVEEWQDVRQIVAGSYCTYAVRFDGSVASVGEGSYGRLGHGGSENETILKNISALQGIPVIQVVAGPRVSTSTDEGFALALTDTGMVYSWGKGYKGRLGHTTAENVRSPKLVEALAGKDIKMLACCDYHCAAVTTSGDLYTFGSKENGKLGHGRDTPSGSIGHVTQITRFLDSDEQTEWEDVKIGHVSCGQTFTLAISDDGSQVFAFGKAENAAFGSRGITGDHFFPMLLNHLAPFGPFVKSSSGNRVSALINTHGQLCWFGKLSDSGTIMEAEFMSFPTEEKIMEAQMASQYMLALTEGGSVYSWGKNTGSTCELGYEVSSIQTTPKLVERLSGKGIKQISAGVRHAAASNSTLPERGVTSIAIPSSIPAQFSALRDLPCPAIHARLLLLNHYSKLMLSSWRLFNLQASTQVEVSQFHINPLSDSNTRSLISPLHVEGMITSVVNRTMVTKSHGPSITVQRITQDDRASRPVFPQIAPQILQKTASELRCPSRAWKVNLVGEGADDAGGVFDETIAQMCEELEAGVVKLLISTPNAKNKCGFNTDRFVFDPTCTSPKDMKHFRFLGILFGVAMRTKKPLDLHLAQPMWKLLAGMTLTSEDLEEVDLMFMQMLYSIRDVHKGGIKEEEFSEMIPIESFECQSMTGNFVPIVPGGSNIKLTYQNRKEYVEKALNFRLHELDHQVAAVREGMSSIIPLPLLSLYTAKMVETAVCGYEEVDIHMLKKVVRYRDGITERDQLVQWLWQTLDLFTNEEKILFLRFVSGRSRLPTRVSEIPQRFQVMKGQSTDGLPTSQTCFFQLRLPNYPSQDLLAERLRYAIRNCRSIDMDNYMLRRNSSHSDLIDYDSDDDEWY